MDSRGPHTGLLSPSPLETAIGIVALGISDLDRDLLSRLAGHHHWKLRFYDSYLEAWTAMSRFRSPILLCNRELVGTDWRAVMQVMCSAPHRTYGILLSRVVDDNVWAEVIRNGGYELLRTPLTEVDVIRAIRLARAYWNDSFQRSPVITK